MKFFDNIKDFCLNITDKLSGYIKVKKQNIEETLEEESTKENYFNKKMLVISIGIFLLIFFIFSYVLLTKKITEENDVEVEEIPPLKIVVPYPNNAINIDDYEILKYKLKSGDNLLNILTKNVGVSIEDAFNILNSLKKVYNVSQLKAGQTLEIKYKIIISQNLNGDIEEKKIVEELKLPDEKDKEIIVSRIDGKYEARKSNIALNKSYLKYKVKINESLFTDGLDAGVPANIMLDFIKFFSFDIDFQRDLRKGDTFEVLFESYYTNEGKKVKDGDILFASIDNQGRIYEIYKFGNNYYSKDGQSVQKSLLKTPVNGARISSNYGYRKHPILGYSKLHSGKDFAAPVGTPIFAAGSGTIVKAQFWSTWGNYVRIKHINGYDTEYAHASKIAPGIKPGVKVRQGQVIAYVGSTGRSTGPHLHYGVLYNNKRINPDRVKSLPTVKLMGKEMANFKSTADKIDLYRMNIPNQNLRLKK